MSIIKNLVEKNCFNTSEVELANYILNHKEKVLEMSIQELSQNTYTSTSTIVRLCRKIGLKGYKHFKIKLSAELQKNYENISDVDANFPFTDDDSYMEISKKIFELTNESLSQTYQLLSSELIEDVVKILLSAKRIGVFAVGDTHVKALGFQNRMMKININVLLTPIPNEEPQLALTLNKSDCAIIVSYSGENRETLKTTEILRTNHVKIITISANPTSHIGKISDVILPLPKKESQSIKFSNFASQVAIEYVFNVLYSCIFIADYDKNQKTRINAETTLLDTRF